MDLFQTVDLYEGQNIPQVVRAMVTLDRKVKAYYYEVEYLPMLKENSS